MMFRIISVFLFLFFLTTNLFAQTTSRITGTVHDQAGAVVAGAKVTARNLETNHTRTIESDAQGRYGFPELRVGQYEVRAERSGFRPTVRSDINLTIGETAVINLLLELVIRDSVEITEEAPLVNTTSAELSYLVGERSIRELPLNGRNYTDLALLQPGVTAFQQRDGGSVVAHGLGMTINGQDIRSNVYLLDGTLLNDFTNGPAGSAATTVLGTETIREFRVEANSYSAEFGRNYGGQINAISKSGTNQFHGTLYYFLRNDNLDARNFFDREPLGKPEFKRNQFGGTVGGPISKDKTFFFVGAEFLRERLGRSILTTVPDQKARQGILTVRNPNGTVVDTNVGVNSAVRPYLDAFPLPNGAPLNNGIGNLAQFFFNFNQRLDQEYTQGRLDHKLSDDQQIFVRYTFDNAEQFLPTDFPQFPRSFLSRNQFATTEHVWVVSPRTINTARFGFSRTRIGQDVSADVNLTPFVPGRLVGDIDIGGIPRFGPQSSVNVQLTQNIFSFSEQLVHTRGKHLLKFGGLLEHYQDNMVNPTFSLGIYNFPDLQAFLENRPNRFIGLTPEAQFDRYWRFNLLGFYVQDDYKIRPRLTINLGLRYEFATMPEDIYGRDVSLPNLSDRQVTAGPLYQNPTYKNISPRFGFAWDIFGDGKTSLRGGYGWYFNTNNQQNLIVTVTNPPATPRPVIANPTFPNPPFNRPSILSIRPVEWNVKNPNVHVYNLNLQRQLWFDTVVTIGYAGARGVHLLRNTDANTVVPRVLSDGTFFYSGTAPRFNTAFSTIELKKSDGNSWYNALILEVRKRFSKGIDFQSSYTFSRSIDTTQASTFFSDATNATVSALPEPPGLDYNKGPADFHAKHNWVFNFTWEIPFAKNLKGAEGAILNGWNLIGIGQLRSGNPLTVFLANNRSQSQWNPSSGPGLGFDRPSLAPGYTYESAIIGLPDKYFDERAFILQPSGTLGNIGRNAFTGPNLRTFDLAAVKNTKWTKLGENTVIQLRVETFNLFNRANFGTPGLQSFAGSPFRNADPLPSSINQEPPIVAGQPPRAAASLSSFGLIRTTVTSARQIQFGLRVSF
ncbi:MAG: carboxypeptidase regulatory-like domain-containing protein [Acidobacteria bacterium]|nr:carboxypeptidase regulatory-like domain-containing protein [Acidobacteriota bacterium]